MKPMISVIVPVYKVEQYLDRCIESIVNQTYRNLEIILVDDGSPDNCPDICDKWVQRDHRIKVIHKENGGAGSARNAGLAAASGSWFTFVDGDDYIAPQMYTRMVSCIHDDVDIVECVMAETFDDGFVFSGSTNQRFVVMNAEQAMSAHIEDTIFCQTPPNKIYRTSVASGILFPSGTLIDDEFWTYRVIGNARKLVHMQAVLYAYRQREESAMHKPFSLKRLQTLDARSQRLEYLRAHYPKLVHKAEIGLWGTSLYGYQMALIYLPRQEQKIARQKVSNILDQIPKDRSRFAALNLKTKIWWIASSVSLGFTCRLRNTLKIGM